MERDFLADAVAHRMAHMPGPFIAIRLADYYKAVREGRLLPEGPASSFVAGSVQVSQAASTLSGNEPVARSGSPARPDPATAVAGPKPPVVVEEISAKKDGGNFSFFFDDDDE